MSNVTHYMEGASYQVQNMSCTGNVPVDVSRKYYCGLKILYFNLIAKIDELAAVCAAETKQVVTTPTRICPNGQSSLPVPRTTI